MKTIILICLVALIATGTFAQSTSTSNNLRTGIMKKAGKVWLVKPMQANETMNNGLLVKPNGMVTTPQGKNLVLGNGDCIGPEGTIIGLNEKNVKTALIRNGKMWVITQLEVPLKLSDGSIVMPDGTVKTIDGSTLALGNNEIVDITSTKYSTWKPSNEMALNK